MIELRRGENAGAAGKIIVFPEVNLDSNFAMF